MSIFTARSGKFSLVSALSDVHVRAGLYLWLVIAGVCVLLANAIGS